MDIIQTAMTKSYDKFIIVIRRDGDEVGQVTVQYNTSADKITTMKFYQIYTDTWLHVATQYALIGDIYRQKADIERTFNCRVVIDECWGHGPELADFHRYIQSRQFDPLAVDDLIRNYKTYKNGKYIEYLEDVKSSILNIDRSITYTLLSSSGRPSLDRAYKSFKL